jgi:hypothetical protein
VHLDLKSATPPNIAASKRRRRWYITVVPLVVLGTALSLLTAQGHVRQPQGVSPHEVSPGRQIRVTLPSHSQPLEHLFARITVRNMTVTETPRRATWRFAWLLVPSPDVARSRTSRSTTAVPAQLILQSGGQQLLHASFDIKSLPAGATGSPHTRPPLPLPAAANSPPKTTSPQAAQPQTTTASTAPATSSQPTPTGGTSGSSPLPGAGLENQGRLTWAPPTLTDPAVVSVANGRDPDVLNLSLSRDYVVTVPSGGIHGTVEINGGHNVVLIGGEITVPSTANQTDNGADDTDTAIYIRGSTGTVHIEGILIRADPNTEFDGIDVNAPQATVHVENVRMDDVYGSRTTEHADVIQTWGGAKTLDVDNLTANGDYQGLQIAPDLGSVENADLQNVDLKTESPPLALAENTFGGGIMLWLTEGTNTCRSSPVTLDNVYVSDLSDRIVPVNTVWPSTSSQLACDPTVTGNIISWPDLPVNGSVTLGAPPQGSFVPEGRAGNAYTSPGYVLASQ